MQDKFILKTGSSLFSKNCRSYFLFTPDGLGDFLDQFEFVPLLQLGQLITDLTGCKATLRAQAETVERNVLLGLMNAGDDGILIFQSGRLGGDQAQYDLLAVGDVLQRLKAAGALVVKFQIERIHILLCQQEGRNGEVIALACPSGMVVAAADMGGDGQAFRAIFQCQIIQAQILGGNILHLGIGFFEEILVIGVADHTPSAVVELDIAAAHGGERNLKIGIISVNEVEWGAQAEKLIQNNIEVLREQNVDLILACCHWGIEKDNYPENYQQQLGRKCIDWGVDLVIGHHPHVLQGIEEYKGRYIIYSLANFCFGANRNPEDKDTMIFQQTFTFENGEKVEDQNARIIPCMVSSVKTRNDFRPTPATGEDAKRILQRMNEYSRDFGVEFDENGGIIVN